MAVRRVTRRAPVRIPALDANNIRASFTQLEGSIREISARLSAMEAGMERAGILAKSSTIASGEAIRPGRFIHVTGTGQAYLAVSTALNRFATDVAVEVNGNSVTHYNVVDNFPICITGVTSGEEAPKIYLSTIKGHGTLDPDEAGAVIQQMLGVRRGQRGTDGKCTASVRPERHIIL